MGWLWYALLGVYLLIAVVVLLVNFIETDFKVAVSYGFFWPLYTIAFMIRAIAFTFKDLLRIIKGK